MNNARADLTRVERTLAEVGSGHRMPKPKRTPTPLISSRFLESFMNEQYQTNSTISSPNCNEDFCLSQREAEIFSLL
jgi:hypothetical protein